MDRFRRQPDRSGVTLFELMAVLVIVGILGVIAVPAYNRYIERARVSEAQTRLGDIMTSAKVWAQEHDEVWPEVGDATDSRLFVMIDSDHFSFTIGAGAGGQASAGLTITAAGLAGGNMAGWTVDIDVDHIDDSAEFTIRPPD